VLRELDVDVPRPRVRTDLLTDQRAQDVKRDALALLSHRGHPVSTVLH